MSLFEEILTARGLNGKAGADFLSPDYSKSYDPFLLNDMDTAVGRLVCARDNQEKVTIYGDYDIDGISATTLLVDALYSFGFENTDIYIPNRFTEGYGLSGEAIKKLAEQGSSLIITVDCGSNSVSEVELAAKLGVDIIVTDHHAITGNLPECVAVINPSRQDNQYPFQGLAGVGVAFKLVQAAMTRIHGIEDGHEKWLLDLVALGTICDAAELIDENRVLVYWGLKVLAKTRRPGLKALMAISGVEPSELNARSIGFSLGPRMNAAGRLETAMHSLNLLTSDDPLDSLSNAEYLNDLNRKRREEQDKIFKEASVIAEGFSGDKVLVLAGKNWNHGIVGIVASKIMEKYKKPTFVLQIMNDETKGSGRSYGDFSAIDAIDASREWLIKGGGHKYAAGVGLLTKNIDNFRKALNDYYSKLKLKNQPDLLLPKVDVIARFDELKVDLINQIAQLEPFGNGNPEPILLSKDLTVQDIRFMGADGQHVKITLSDGSNAVQFISFNAPDKFRVELGDKVNATYSVTLNEWRGVKSVEGRLLHLDPVK